MFHLHKATPSHNTSGEPKANKIRARATPLKHTQLTESLGLGLLASTCHHRSKAPPISNHHSNPQILRRRACAFKLSTDHWPPIGLPGLDNLSAWRLFVNAVDDIRLVFANQK